MAAMDKIEKLFTDVQSNLAKELQAIRESVAAAGTKEGERFVGLETNLVREVQALRDQVTELSNK